MNQGRKTEGRKDPDLFCIGMALVDSIIRGFRPEPVSASGYVAESAALAVGGEAVNEAIAAAKLGMKTGIICALGEDEAGEMVRSALRRCGAETAYILPAAGTPVTTMFVREDGSRKSITNQAHRVCFRPDPQVFTRARGVILGSLFRAPFDDPETVYETVKAAGEAGQTVFADTKLPNFRKLTLADLRDSLPRMDYITPNEDEARFFSGKEDPREMADVFLGYGVKNVIIKLGARGCYLKNGEGELTLPPCPIRAVDATGAGDNFLAGFACEILRGADPGQALRFANACGAVCATAVGASTALKNREQVLDMMRKAEARI